MFVIYKKYCNRCRYVLIFTAFPMDPAIIKNVCLITDGLEKFSCCCGKLIKESIT